jgi:hypothetical protein
MEVEGNLETLICGVVTGLMKFGRSDIESRDVLRSCVKYDAIGEEMIGGGGKFGGSEVEVVEDKWMSLVTPCPTKCR